MNFERPIIKDILRTIKDLPPLIHVLSGARQVGKSTAAEQLVEKIGLPYHFATADSPVPYGPEWIEIQWDIASKKALLKKKAVLVIDEVQKIRGWSEIIKRKWDRDKRNGHPIIVLLLGSSSLLLEEGLSESLAGRFFLHRFPHWSLNECEKAFGFSLNQWIYFGGYPGAAPIIQKEKLWKSYINDSLIETAISRDVLQMQKVQKPTLLRNLCGTALTFPAQIVSYTKMLGTLVDAGNTTTLAHYLHLLEGAFLASGLELFSKGSVRKRGSSPKVILWNNALVSAASLFSFEQALEDRIWWGRLVENAVGAHFLNTLKGKEWSISYWRDGNAEVDFVLSKGSAIIGIEVKSGRPGRISGLTKFKAKYPKAKMLLIGEDGISLEKLFLGDAEKFMV